MRRGSAPGVIASKRKICDPLSRLSVTAKVRPSGDQVGALLEPLKFATKRRLAVSTSCTYTDGFLASNDT